MDITQENRERIVALETRINTLEAEMRLQREERHRQGGILQVHAFSIEKLETAVQRIEAAVITCSSGIGSIANRLRRVEGRVAGVTGIVVIVIELVPYIWHNVLGK